MHSREMAYDYCFGCPGLARRPLGDFTLTGRSWLLSASSATDANVRKPRIPFSAETLSTHLHIILREIVSAEMDTNHPKMMAGCLRVAINMYRNLAIEEMRPARLKSDRRCRAYIALFIVPLIALRLEFSTSTSTPFPHLLATLYSIPPKLSPS
jgi:hypothetical protein